MLTNIIAWSQDTPLRAELVYGEADSYTLAEAIANSLEITKAVSKQYLGIPFMRVTAHSRHIQQGIGLVPAKDFVLRMPVAALTKEEATKQYTALISSS